MYSFKRAPGVLELERIYLALSLLVLEGQVGTVGKDPYTADTR